MSLSKSINGKNARKRAIPAVSPRPFVRAAVVANLIVAAQVSVVFALFTYDGKSFPYLLWLIPFVTLVVWGSATVLYLVPLASLWLGTFARRLIGPVRSSPSRRSGVWDNWLDSPEPHHP